MANHPNRGLEMIKARKIASRLDTAIATATGRPAGFNKSYAQAVRRNDGRTLVVALYDADRHEENFTSEQALRACEYFEAGGKIRMSVKAYLNLDDDAPTSPTP